MRATVFFAFIFLIQATYAQDAERDKIRLLEQQKEFEKARLVRQEMDSGIYWLEHEQYARAEDKLRYALSNMRSIPSDLTFYFGKNSYFIGKFKQSVDWLTKYIQLKGTSGKFSTEAADWLKKAEYDLLKERQAETVKASEILSKDYNIDCGPSGKVVCPVCNGSTVTIKKDYFGEEKYKTCPYCNKLGYLSCEDYNLLLRGQLKTSVNK